MIPHSTLDQMTCRFDKILKILLPTSFVKKTSLQTHPADTTFLSPTEQKHSAMLMRINHSGEVCAQALYLGQALTARDQNLANQLSLAAEEERIHLQWCQERIEELEGRRSFLNPFWAFGSVVIGAIAGLMGDKVSLGFLAETEQQVSRHLDQHLKEISVNDKKSRAILTQMRIDEQRHATNAFALGGVALPKPIRAGMTFLSKIMTSTTRFF